MKTAIGLIGGLLLSAVLAGPAEAVSVRVKVTARVSDVNDSGNVLAGKIVVGSRVTGTYVYNTNTPNQSQNPGVGEYHPYANEARMRFVAGSFVFENVQPTQDITILVQSQNFGEGHFTMFSHQNKLLANGASVSDIFLDYRGNGNITESEALPNAAPDLTRYYVKDLTLNGSGVNGNSYFVHAIVEVAELVVADAIEMSPASGSFIPAQRFDAALTLPRNSVVSTARATANGQFLPLSYPGNCQLQPPNSAGKPSLLCQNAEVAAAIADGAPIDLTVELTNGTVLTETVNWEIVR